MFEIRRIDAIVEEGQQWFDTPEQAIQWAWLRDGPDTTETAYGVVNVETGEVVCILFQGLEFWP